MIINNDGTVSFTLSEVAIIIAGFADEGFLNLPDNLQDAILYRDLEATIVGDEICLA